MTASIIRSTVALRSSWKYLSPSAAGVKMTYYAKTAMVIHRSKLHATLKRNFQLMPAFNWS